MPADLSGARAKLSWAHNLITILDAGFRLFAESKPYSVVHDANLHGDGFFIRLEKAANIPAEFQVHTGQIIAAQRDSLDLLANALAEKNGAVEPRDVYFPICDSLDGFNDKRSKKKIARLSPADRAVIEGLKPYAGGNNLLHSLHTLNNKSKHRKLIVLGAANTGLGIGGNGHIRKIEVFGAVSLDNDAPIAFVDADPGIQLDITVDVAFREDGHTAFKPVIPTLREFGSVINEIIDLFR